MSLHIDYTGADRFKVDFRKTRDSLQVDSIISDANFYIITRDANQEISGFQAFSGQNRDNFQFVPNSGRAPEFGTFWHHCIRALAGKEVKLG